MEWWQILSYVVGIAGIVLGVTFKLKWDQLVKLLLELGEAFTKTGKALEDKKLTKEEAVTMLKEWNDVYLSLMALLPKKLVSMIRSKSESKGA